MLSKFYSIDKATGINIHIAVNGEVAIALCYIELKGGKLTFGKKLTKLGKLADVSKYIPEKAYVAVNITGSSVITKQLEATDPATEYAASSVLPSANNEDFYVQSFVSEKAYVSIIRKEEADKWLNEIKKIGLIPLSLSLGPFAVTYILPQLNNYGEVLIFNGHEMRFDKDGKLHTFYYSDGLSASYPLKLESEKLDEALLLPYAVAFQLVLYGQIDPVKAIVTDLDNSISETIANRRFKVLGAVLLMMFFVLLLFNFCLLTRLNNENTELSSKVSQSTQANLDVDKLNDKIRQGEKNLKDLGWDDGISKSGMIDKLASVMPEEITLTSIEVNPIDKQATQSTRVETRLRRTIIIEGTTTRLINVNEWIAVMRSKKWFKDIDLLDYSYNKEINTGEFKLSIKY